MLSRRALLSVGGCSFAFCMMSSASALAAPEPKVFDPRGASTVRFTEEIERRFEIPAHDGTALHVRLFRPVTTPQAPEWKAPVILVSSPYFDWIQRAELPSHRDLRGRYVPQGYAVAFASIRGTGRSGGCLEIDGPNESRDFKTMAEYLARQPWSNGRVGSYGLSYDGESQFAGARLRPAGLAAMVTLGAISGIYDGGFLDGVPLEQSDLVFIPNTPDALDGFVFYAFLTGSTLHLRRPGCQLENAQASADVSGDMTTYHAAREFRLSAADIEPAVLYVQSLRDPIVRPLNIVGWYDILPGFKRALLGNWPEHAVPYPNPGTADPGEVDAYADASFARDDWFDMVDAWFDRFLLGLDTDVESWPSVQVQDDHNVWREVGSISGMGVLHDYVLGRHRLGASASPGLPRIYREEGKAVWLGDPLPSPLHVSGQALLDATIALDRDDGHLAATLQEHEADGTVRTLTSGYLSARHRPLSHNPTRAGLTGEPGRTGNEGRVPVGVAREYRIRFIPFDAWLAAGSRLRLELSGSNADSYPAGSLYTAQVAVDGRSVLRLPVVTRTCGLIVRSSAPPRAMVPGCEGP